MASSLAAGGRRRGGIVGINVTPMVDVVLVLLVIMMVSATYIVELPKSQSSDEAVPTVAQVTIQKDGKFFFNQQPVDEQQLVSQLRASKAGNPEVNLVITADANALHGMVVHVIDLSKLEGITKFAINIQRD